MHIQNICFYGELMIIKVKTLVFCEYGDVHVMSRATLFACVPYIGP